MAIGQESVGGLGTSGIMQRSIRAWQQKRIADAQEEANRQKEQQAKAQQQEKSSSGEKKKNLFTPSSEIGVKSIMGTPAVQRAGAGSGGATPAAFGSNSMVMFKALTELGVKPEVAAGAVGSMMGESGRRLDPAAFNPNDNGLPSGGALQWRGDRLAGLYKFAGTTDIRQIPLETQAKWMQQELQGNERAALDSLLRGNTVADGARAWTYQFERPADKAGETAKRTQTGEQFWSSMQNGTIGTTTPSNQNRDAGNGQSPVKLAANPTTPSSGFIQSSSTLAGVDSRLINIMNAAAQGLPAGYSVRATSGERDQSYGFHPKGLAADFQIIGPKGPIPNRGEDSTGLYTQLAKNAYAAQQQLYPDLSGKLAWGGAFATVPGGNVADLMHFDLGGERGNLHPEFRPSRLVSGGDMPARTQIAAADTVRNDASPSRQQDMGGASAPATAGAPMATTPVQGTNTVTPAATTPSAAGTPTTGNPMATAPMPPTRPAEYTQVPPSPPRRPSDLTPEFPNNIGQQPGAPPRRPEMGPPTPNQPTPQPAAQPQPQPDSGKGIGGFFDSLFGSGEPIKDQYGRTWDGFEGWVDPKAKAETAKPEEAKAEEKGILDGLFGGADSGPDLFSGEMGIFSNLAKLFS